MAAGPQIYPQGRPEVKIRTLTQSISPKMGELILMKRIKINTPELKFQENMAQAAFCLPLGSRYTLQDIQLKENTEKNVEK